MLVKNDTLTTFARGYGFEERAKLPAHLIAEMERGASGNGKGKGKGWAKVLGDIFEAYVAAVVLDAPEGGFERAETWMRELWMPMLRDDLLSTTPNPITNTSVEAGSQNCHKITRPDFPKVELSKRVMGKGIKINYRCPDATSTSASDPPRTGNPRGQARRDSDGKDIFCIGA